MTGMRSSINTSNHHIANEQIARVAVPAEFKFANLLYTDMQSDNSLHGIDSAAGKYLKIIQDRQ